MHPPSASLGNGTYNYSASFDDDVRLSSVTTSLASGGTTLFSSTRTYDNIGNVATVATTLSAGTDNQAFCYDEQNRLGWAGSSGTPPCTGTPISAGSLTSAQYSASYSYDALNRLTSAPTLGTYAYGSAPLHGATSATSGSTTDYSASYDAAGDMTCRAPSEAPWRTGLLSLTRRGPGAIMAGETHHAWLLPPPRMGIGNSMRVGRRDVGRAWSWGAAGWATPGKQGNWGKRHKRR